MWRKGRVFIVSGILLFTALTVISWSKGGQPTQARVVIAGSTCMGRMLGALSEAYNRTQNGWVQPQLGGTELGLQALRQGVCDIASCSRALTGQEAVGIDSRLVALDAIAVAVHPSNPVTGLSIRTLRNIYAGIITDWSQLGGPEMPIVVVGREAGSGTRNAFESAIGLILPAAHSQEHSETGMLRTAVSAAPGAIGYLSFDYIDASVRQLSVEGVFPGEETVRTGQYPISRGFWLCTRVGERRGEVTGFLDYATGAAGRQVIRSLGMLPPEPVAGALS